MEASMLGVIVAVIAVLTSVRFGWDLPPNARVLLMLSGIGFGLGLALPALAMGDDLGARDWLIGGRIATAAGALLLVMGVLSFSRRA